MYLSHLQTYLPDTDKEGKDDGSQPIKKKAKKTMKYDTDKDDKLKIYTTLSLSLVVNIHNKHTPNSKYM